MDIIFHKYQGLGNDYIIINTKENNISINEEVLSDLAQSLCDRHFSIGADGILYAIPSLSDDYDYEMRIFNPDGSEAEMCGNGIRMFAKYLYLNDILKKKKFIIKTLAGKIIPELIFDDNEIVGIKVNMGYPNLNRAEIPMLGPEGKVIHEEFIIDNKTFRITCVNMGNPHCIMFVDDINEIDITVGKKIEYDERFPERTNVEFAQILNNKELKLRVWERGVGETLACGTGACATVVAAILNSKTDNEVLVHLKGGDLEINWKNSETEPVLMTGPAEEVFRGEITIK
ncbi:MAG: diaminopimelate epimerase [Promethearchaeota archaeon]|nr:MAG: diaminopimelate epimerase [Candidatus Lokiarchaeota archaeon]